MISEDEHYRGEKKSSVDDVHAQETETEKTDTGTNTKLCIINELVLNNMVCGEKKSTIGGGHIVSQSGGNRIMEGNCNNQVTRLNSVASCNPDDRLKVCTSVQKREQEAKTFIQDNLEKIR